MYQADSVPLLQSPETIRNSNSVFGTLLRSLGADPREFQGPFRTPGLDIDLRSAPSNNPDRRSMQSDAIRHAGMGSLPNANAIELMEVVAGNGRSWNERASDAYGSRADFQGRDKVDDWRLAPGSALAGVQAPETRASVGLATGFEPDLAATHGISGSLPYATIAVAPPYPVNPGDQALVSGHPSLAMSLPTDTSLPISFATSERAAGQGLLGSVPEYGAPAISGVGGLFTGLDQMPLPDDSRLSEGSYDFDWTTASPLFVEPPPFVFRPVAWPPP